MHTIITDFQQVVRYWWIFLVSGSLLILFGLTVFFLPATAYTTLTALFIIAFILNGIVEISFGLFNRHLINGWGWHLAGGIFDLLVGIVLLVIPVMTAVTLPIFAGFWLMFRSVAIIGRTFDLRNIVWPERAWMTLLGLAGLVFSFIILYNPQFGMFTLVIWTGFALLAIGLFYIFLGMRLRSAQSKD